LTQLYRKHTPASNTVVNTDGSVPSEIPNKVTKLITVKGNKSNGKLLPGETYKDIKRYECEFFWDVTQR
jgi:hypothetical protein